MTEGLLIGAFLGGLLSFLAPCVLPIIPGFLAYLAGTSTIDAGSKRRDIFINSVFFVLGFSIVFAALGILIHYFLIKYGLGRFSYDVYVWLSRAGGL
ncbi:MAG: cytochrome c biogenesis protein CcdA, partial [Patescibacteria group bacterium]